MLRGWGAEDIAEIVRVFGGSVLRSLMSATATVSEKIKGRVELIAMSINEQALCMSFVDAASHRKVRGSRSRDPHHSSVFDSGKFGWVSLR